MFSEDEAPASVEIEVGDQVYDMNNIPGDVKRALIEQGKVSPSKFFIAPPGIDRNNAPGSILGPLRAEHEKRMRKLVTGKVKGNPYAIGETVVFKKEDRQVVAISSKNANLLKLTDGKGGQSGWIDYNKVKPVKVDEEE